MAISCLDCHPTGTRAAGDETMTADSTCSSSKEPTKLIKVQLESPDTSLSGDVSDALSDITDGRRHEEDSKDSTTIEDGQTDANGDFLDGLLSPASEHPTPDQLRSKRFSRNANPHHALSLESSSPEDIAPTDIDYQSLPSPPEPVVVGYVDRNFGADVQTAYEMSVLRQIWRVNKYGEDASKFKRGFTPSPLRQAYIEREEEAVRLDEVHTTDSEPSSSPDHQAYLERQEEYMRLAKMRAIDSEPSSPTAHPASSYCEAEHQDSKAFQGSNTTSASPTLERFGEDSVSREAQVSPPPVSLHACSDDAMEQEDPALQAMTNQQLAQRAGSKRRRCDLDDGLKQEGLLGGYGDSVQKRPWKRLKRAPA